jgi:KAP family P-loop domain/Putative peptidoglycan binding domain
MVHVAWCRMTRKSGKVRRSPRRVYGKWQVSMARAEPKEATPPILATGAKGELVASLQGFLGEQGFYRGPPDGIYGPATEKAVKSFQIKGGLAADGTVGPGTWDLLQRLGMQEVPGAAATAPVKKKAARPAAASAATRRHVRKPATKRGEEPSGAEPTGRVRAGLIAPMPLLRGEISGPASSIVPLAAPSPSITPDMWVKDDSLGYMPFARALATLITHPDTRPPLTISIKAPWGAGKTSMMRMVQYLLDDKPEHAGFVQEYFQGDGSGQATATPSAERPNPEGIAVDGDWNPQISYKQFLETLENPTKDRPAIAFQANPGQRHRIPARATVWFNPWKYQSSEQIWAGLAHCIISQVTSRLPALDRERFWLRLQARRLDLNGIRQDVYGLLLSEFAPRALGWAAGAGGLALLALSLPGGWSVLPWIGSVAAAGGGVGTWLQHLDSGMGRRLEGKFREYIRAPDYEGKLGFLHLVESDIGEILGLVATPERPLVVFIDDLDRCAPHRVAEVVEGINLFLAGNYPNCIFVVGMEPEMVAAALEVANREWMDKVREFAVVDPHSPLGWRFMDKIVQLPLTLPAPDESGLSRFLGGLLRDSRAADGRYPERDARAAGGPRAVPPQVPEEAVGRYEEEFRKAPDVAGVVEKTRDMLRGGQSAPEKAAIAEASERVYAEKFRENDPVITDFVRRAAVLLQSNPRQIKRCINLFRFVSTLRHEYRVDKLELTGKEPERLAGDEVLAKFVVLSIHWPQALGWLRTVVERKADGRAEAANATLLSVVEEKAMGLAAAKGREEADAQWREFLQQHGLDLPWAADGGFREFLAAGESLRHYEASGLW